MDWLLTWHLESVWLWNRGVDSAASSRVDARWPTRGGLPKSGASQLLPRAASHGGSSLLGLRARRLAE